jgi:hypothetical protein
VFLSPENLAQRNSFVAVVAAAATIDLIELATIVQLIVRLFNQTRWGT